VFERLVCQQNLNEFLGLSLLGRYKVRNGYANSVTRFIPRALRSYAVTQLRILYPTVSIQYWCVTDAHRHTGPQIIPARR